MFCSELKGSSRCLSLWGLEVGRAVFPKCIWGKFDTWVDFLFLTAQSPVLIQNSLSLMSRLSDSLTVIKFRVWWLLGRQAKRFCVLIPLIHQENRAIQRWVFFWSKKLWTVLLPVWITSRPLSLGQGSWGPQFPGLLKWSVDASGMFLPPVYQVETTHPVLRGPGGAVTRTLAGPWLLVLPV